MKTQQIRKHIEMIEKKNLKERIQSLTYFVCGVACILYIQILSKQDFFYRCYKIIFQN